MERRNIGPAMLPNLQNLENEEHASDSESSSDYGPQPPSSHLTEEEINAQERASKIQEIEARACLEKISKTDNKPSAYVKRDDWMTIPPDSLRSIGDSKSRKFSQKGKEQQSDSSLWTAKPSDRSKVELEIKKRKREEELAKNRPSKQDLDIKAAICVHNESIRGPSLFEQHKLKNPENINELPPRFNRERDIVGRRVDLKSKQNILNDAKELESKFSVGRKTFL